MEDVTQCSVVEMHWAFSDETEMSLMFYREECNPAFMFCSKMEVAHSLKRFINFHQVTLRHSTVDGTNILFTQCFCLLRVSMKSKYPLKTLINGFIVKLNERNDFLAHHT
jgi:hypothetical protein